MIKMVNKMKIRIGYKEYEDLKVLKEADAQKLINRFGKPDKEGYDGVLKDIKVVKGIR